MFLTLDEYLLGARKLLSLYGYRCQKNDEDAISYVAHRMMLADQTWDGHSSSRDTWRFNQARYAIMKLKTKKQKSKKLVSLNKIISKSGDKDIYLYDSIIHNTRQDFIAIFNQVMDHAKKALSNRQFECLRLYYQENMTLDKIGQALGITKQAVSLHIKNGIERIRDECKSKIDYSTH